MTKRDESHRLLCEIVHCSSIPTALNDAGHPCSEVIRFQERFDGPFQPPTPWVGRLSEAPILFIGSNPNIGGNEHYPTVDWSGRELVDFFDEAFEEGGQIKDGTKAKQADGRYGNSVRTWGQVRGRARELLQREPRPGIDYAMSEVVHCRSWNEIGVAAARDHCADLYLDSTIALSGARVIVALGAQVRDWLRTRWELRPDPVSPLPTDSRRLIAFLPHPTSFGPKTFAHVMPNELPRLQAALGASHQHLPES